MKNKNGIGSENLLTEENKDLLEHFKALPYVKNAWFYRGQIHLAVPTIDYMTVIFQYLHGRWIVGDEMGNTTTLISGWKTAEAESKQFEAQMNYETAPLKEAHYEHLRHLLSVHGEPDEFSFRTEKRIRRPKPKMNLKDRKFIEYYTGDDRQLATLPTDENNYIHEFTGKVIEEDEFSTIHSTIDEKNAIQDARDERDFERKANLRGVEEGYVGYIYGEERFSKNSEHIRLINGMAIGPIAIPGDEKLYEELYPSPQVS